MVTFTFSFSQDCIIENKKERRLIKKVNSYIDKGRSNSRDLYNAMDLIANPHENTVFRSALRAQIFWLREKYFKSEKEALSVIEECPDNFPIVYYILGSISFNRKDYVSAFNYLQKSIELQLSDPYYSNAMMLFDQATVLADILLNPVPFNPEVLKGVSTSNDEYLAVISPDQELAFFTRRLIKSSKQHIAPTTVEEFVCSKKKGSFFSVGSRLGYPFNSNNNEGGASVSIDNNTLYFTRCIRDRKGYNNCDICYVNRIDDKWSEVKDFSKNISKRDSWESQPTVSPDGKKIIFSSDRKGGYGKTDLYEIIFQDGKWSNPRNIGPIINSNKHEKSPYLHTDGKTLFFSSTNFPSIGGFDIFYTKKDSLGNWKKPINIGYPINTINDELSLFVSTDGSTAYFASNQLKGNGGWDIYEFPLYPEARPDRVLFLKGMLLDGNGTALEDVEIEMKNINTNEITISKVKKGQYVSALTLDGDDDVLLTVKKQGYAFHSSYISHDDEKFSSPSRLDLNIKKLEDNHSFEIENIYFSNNSYEINRVSSEVIFEFSNYLIVNKDVFIEINGFTDNIGDSRDNQILSENRAEAVYNLIVSNGVDRGRLSFNGYGEEFPVSTNNSEYGRSKNRRTEFKVLSK